MAGGMREASGEVKLSTEAAFGSCGSHFGGSESCMDMLPYPSANQLFVWLMGWVQNCHGGPKGSNIPSDYERGGLEEDTAIDVLSHLPDSEDSPMNISQRELAEKMGKEGLKRRKCGNKGGGNTGERRKEGSPKGSRRSSTVWKRKTHGLGRGEIQAASRSH